MEGHVKFAVHNGIGTITFSHPAHNSMPGYQLKALTEAIGAASGHEEVRVILLQSGGNRTFCAGASFEELASLSDLTTGQEFFMGFANVINACRQSPKLILGRVQGKAVGGGVGLAAAVDYCFATQFASVKLSELALGIGPFVVGPAVERKIGTARFSEMSINAIGWKSADWARQSGLYAETFDSTDEMDERIASFCAELADMDGPAMEQLKRVIWAGTEHWDTLLQERAAISGRLVLSDFTKEAIQKIKSRDA